MVDGKWVEHKERSVMIKDKSKKIKGYCGNADPSSLDYARDAELRVTQAQDDAARDDGVWLMENGLSAKSMVLKVDVSTP